MVSIAREQTFFKHLKKVSRFMPYNGIDCAEGIATRSFVTPA